MIVLVQQRKNSINLTKENINISLCLHHNECESYFYEKNCKFKVHDNISWYKFSLESVSKDFT